MRDARARPASVASAPARVARLRGLGGSPGCSDGRAAGSAAVASPAAAAVARPCACFLATSGASLGGGVALVLAHGRRRRRDAIESEPPVPAGGVPGAPRAAVAPSGGVPTGTTAAAAARMTFTRGSSSLSEGSIWGAAHMRRASRRARLIPNPCDRSDNTLQIEPFSRITFH
jgi:hypothetical protein